jgi:hypothetical protein
MNRSDKILIAAGLVLGIVAVAGCMPLHGASKAAHPVHVAHVPYHAHFDPAHCRYLPDGIRFKCKDVVFDPTEINVKK